MTNAVGSIVVSTTSTKDPCPKALGVTVSVKDIPVTGGVPSPMSTVLMPETLATPDAEMLPPVIVASTVMTCG